MTLSRDKREIMISETKGVLEIYDIHTKKMRYRQFPNIISNMKCIEISSPQKEYIIS